MLLMVFVCLLHICNGQGETKYVMNFDSPIYAYGDESQQFMDTSKIEVERHNESTAYMHGDMVFLQGLPDKAILEIILQKETSGKYEVLFSHDVCDLCTELGDENSDYKKYFKYFGIPSECPFDAGSYKIHDFCLDMEDVEISSQHAGRYQLLLSISVKTGDNCQKDKELKCMLMMDLIIEPE